MIPEIKCTKHLPTYEQLYERISEEKKAYYKCRWGYNCTTTTQAEDDPSPDYSLMTIQISTLDSSVPLY